MAEKTKESQWSHRPGHGRNPGTLGKKASAAMDAREAKAILYQGVTVTDLSILFRMDPRTIQSKIISVKACGTRGVSPIYQIRDVTPFLVRPAGNIEEYIKKMRHNDLPALLTKEFWNGQRAKQRFMEDEGDLWRTDRVVEVLATVFKTVKMNLLLLPDQIERRSVLSDHQREELRNLIDATLETTREALVKEFGEDDGSRTGPGIASAEVPDEDDLFAVPPDFFHDDDGDEEL